MRPLAEYEQKVVRMRQRGHDLSVRDHQDAHSALRRHTQAEFPPGDFVEYDLDATENLIPVDRPYGQNKSNIIVGVIRNFTSRYPEGMARVMLLGRSQQGFGSARRTRMPPHYRRPGFGRTDEQFPLEWFPISAGRQNLDGQRRGEHGLDRPCAAPAD